MKYFSWNEILFADNFIRYFVPTVISDLMFILRGSFLFYFVEFSFIYSFKVFCFGARGSSFPIVFFPLPVFFFLCSIFLFSFTIFVFFSYQKFFTRSSFIFYFLEGVAMVHNQRAGGLHGQRICNWRFSSGKARVAAVGRDRSSESSQGPRGGTVPRLD